jgi:hypothetical protein
MGIAKQSLSFTNFCGIILLCDLCRKRHLNSSASVEQDYSASKLSESGLFYDGHNIHSPTNAALILENIKQEVESLDADYLDEKSLYSSRKRLSADIAGVPGMDDGFDSVRYSLKACKQEGDSLGDDADNIFNLFASLFDSSLTGTTRFTLFILHLVLNLEKKLYFSRLKFHMVQAYIAFVCLKFATGIMYATFRRRDFLSLLVIKL